MTASDQGAGGPPPPPPPQQPAGPPRVEQRAAGSATSPPPWEIVVMASGLLMLIFSFLAWYKIGDFGSWSAWSNAFNLFPLTAVIVLITVGLAGVVGAARFGGVSPPEDLGGFSWSDLRLLAGVLGTLTLLAYLLRSTEGLDKGIGLIFATLAGIGLLVGAVMERQENPAPAVSETGGGGGQSSPAAIVIMGAGVVILIASFLPALKSGSESVSAWSSGYFPLYTLPALLGVVMAAQVAITEFARTRVPGAVLGLSWPKIHLALGAWAALMMLSLLIGRVAVADVNLDADISKGVGFWIMLLASIALVAGAVMRGQETGSSPSRGAPPTEAPPPPPPPPR